jgi:acyl-CoA thioesterase FadM
MEAVFSTYLGGVVAEAKCVLVGYDYERAQSAPIPERWRRRLSG